MGDYKNNKREGHGVMKNPGSTYDGQWKNDKQEGKGTSSWKNGRRYEGDFKNDEISGEGRWRWSDGRSFHGKFKSDCPLEGCLVDSDGCVYKVSYNGKSDVGDPNLKPVKKVKLPDPEGANFAKAAGIWESRIAAAASLQPLTEKLSELELEFAKVEVEHKKHADVQAKADAKRRFPREISLSPHTPSPLTPRPKPCLCLFLSLSTPLNFKPLESGPFPRLHITFRCRFAVAEAAKQDEIVSKVFKELDSAAVSLVRQTRLNAVFNVHLFRADSHKCNNLCIHLFAHIFVRLCVYVCLYV